jgi:carbon-monoxide dehydrogenase small subunit
MSKHHVTTTINGEPVEFLCEAQETMLDVLRNTLNLTGSKEGCASGDCGACSVICDGKLICSCLMLGVEAEGRAITTVEGIANGDELHPVQRKFLEHAALLLEHAALQCGFCTPGLIVASKALLDENPNPTEEEARYWLAGNLCRCTGYDKILAAVLDAAAEMRGESRA